MNVYYLHAPDRVTPLKDTLEGVNELYKAGKFKRFGLSNFQPSEVLEVIKIAKENGFVLPSVYEGLYNMFNRRSEKDIFPILRENNISFYAYSPIAGGFLTKTPEDVTNGKGRFGKAAGFFSQLYNGLYNKPIYLDFLASFGKVAADTGLSQAELAHRWLAYHSLLDPEKGDAIIFGSRAGAQMDSTIEWFKKGPLSAEVVQQLEELWKTVEGEMFLDNFNGWLADNKPPPHD